MLDFALQLRQEKDPGAVEWLRATGRKGHPLACALVFLDVVFSCPVDVVVLVDGRVPWILSLAFSPGFRVLCILQRF